MPRTTLSFGEAMPRRAIDEYVVHYNAERPHLGIGNVVIDGRTPTNASDSKRED